MEKAVALNSRIWGRVDRWRDRRRGSPNRGHNQRVVFVLRNAFDLTFEEIAPVVRRDVVACRKIFSRARARVTEDKPRFTVDRARHRSLVHSFLEAARGNDMDKLLLLLDDKVVLHGDGGGKVLATKKSRL